MNETRDIYEFEVQTNKHTTLRPETNLQHFPERPSFSPGPPYLTPLMAAKASNDRLKRMVLPGSLRVSVSAGYDFWKTNLDGRALALVKRPGGGPE
jgi:hypothetical protein